MKLTLTTPTKLNILPESDHEVSELRRILKYKDKQVEMQIRNLKKNYYLRQRYGDEYVELQLSSLSKELWKSLLFEDDSGFWTYPGLLKRLTLSFTITGVSNLVPYPEYRLIPWSTTPKHEMYYYQREAMEELLKIPHSHVELPTGSGKSVLIMNLIKQSGLKTIVVAPSSSIVKQLYDDAIFCFGKKNVGLFSGAKKQHDKRIVIATAQSLVRVDGQSDAFNSLSHYESLIFDECFPYDTNVLTNIGSLRIGTLHKKIQSGEKIYALSWNEINKKFEYKKIKNSWKRPPQKTLQITTTSMKFNCTYNHKILTVNGWTEAVNLEINDCILSAPGERSVQVINDDQRDYVIGSFLGDGNLQVLKSGLPRLRVIHGEGQKDYLFFGHSLMSAVAGKLEIIEKNGYAQTKAYRFSTRSLWHKDFQEFPNKKTNCPQWIINLLNLKSLAVWFMDDGSLNGKLYTGSFDEDSVDRMIKKINEMGYECRKTLDKGKYYCIYFMPNGIKKLSCDIAPFVHESMQYKLRNSENKIFEKYKWISEVNTEFRVSKVLSMKDGKSEDFNYRDFLYDVEVEDNHNFVITSSRNKAIKSNGGLVVHNCHQCPANTFSEVCHGLLKDVPYRWFCSATPERNDGKDLLLEGIIGARVYEKSISELQEEGYLAKLTTLILDVDSPNPSYHSQNSVKMNQIHLYRNEKIASAIAEMTRKAVESNMPTLILVDEHEQEELLKKFMTVEYAYACGGSDVNDICDRFNAGKLMCVVGTSAVSTGTNFLPVQLTVCWQGGRAGTKVKQGAIGRSTRVHKATEKTSAKIVDFRVQGVHQLTRHANERIEYYREVGPVLFGKI